MKKTSIGLTKSMAQSVTRRGARKKCGVGASEALAGGLKLRQERHVYSHGASRASSSVRSGISGSPGWMASHAASDGAWERRGRRRFYKHGPPPGAIRKLRG